MKYNYVLGHIAKRKKERNTRFYQLKKFLAGQSAEGCKFCLDIYEFGILSLWEINACWFLPLRFNVGNFQNKSGKNRVNRLADGFHVNFSSLHLYTHSFSLSSTTANWVRLFCFSHRSHFVRFYKLNKRTLLFNINIKKRTSKQINRIFQQS